MKKPNQGGSQKSTVHIDNSSYLNDRLAENGITKDETRFLFPTLSHPHYLTEDKEGNIEIFYCGLDGEPLRGFRRKDKNYFKKSEPEIVEVSEVVKRTRFTSEYLPNSPVKRAGKYKTPFGQLSKYPFLNGLVSYCKDWNTIRTLVITEGEFKALRASKAGIATIGIAGISTFSTPRDNQYRTKAECERVGKPFKPVTASLYDIWHDLLKELPNLENVIFLHDADALEDSAKDKIKGTQTRKKDFFTSVEYFHFALKNKPYNLYYAHGKSDQYKGIDDLLNSGDVSDAEVKEKLLSLKKSSLFEVFPFNTPEERHEVRLHFFPNYKRQIGCNDLEVNVYQYLSECEGAILEGFKKYKRVLLDAPTGTGKTHFLFNYAKTSNKRMIFAVPYRSQVDQIAKEYEVYSIKGGDGVPEIETAKTQPVVVCTFDMLNELITGFDSRNDLLVVDESHNLVNQDFRKETSCEAVFKAAMLFDNSVLISGTPNPFFECLPNGFKRLRVNRSLKKNVTAKPVYLETRKERLQYVIDQLTEHKDEPLQAVKLNNKDQLDSMEEMLLRNGFKASQIAKIYNRNELEQDASYLSIINEGRLPDTVKILLSTSKINDGVNIKNPIKNVYLIDENCPDAIIQFIGRFRKSEKLEVSFLCKEKTIGGREGYNDIFGGLVGFSKAMQREFKAFKDAERIAFNTGLDLTANIERPHQKTLFSDGSIDWLGLLIEAKRLRDEGLTTKQLLKEVSNYGIEICEAVTTEKEVSEVLSELIIDQKEGKKEARGKAIEMLKEAPKEFVGAVMSLTKGKELRKKCSSYLGSSEPTYQAKSFRRENEEFLIRWQRITQKLVGQFLTLAKYFPEGDSLKFAEYLEVMNGEQLVRQIENAYLIYNYQVNKKALSVAQREDAKLMLKDMEEVQEMGGATLNQVTERLNSLRKYAYLRRNGRQYRERFNSLFLEVKTFKNAEKETVLECRKPVNFKAYFNIFSHAKNSCREKALTY